MKERKHAALIKAWADGAAIERYSNDFKAWVDEPWPMFMDDLEYRIKETNTVKRLIYMDFNGNLVATEAGVCNVEFTFSPSGSLESVRKL